MEQNDLAAKRANTINMMWEYVQAVLAISLVLAMVFACIYNVLHARTNPTDIPESLKAACFIVLGFYFGRTNHSRPVPGKD